MARHFVDNYGTKIYELTSSKNIDRYDAKRSVIVKIREFVKSEKFKYVLNWNDWYVYVNKTAEVDLPLPINGILHSSAGLVIISGPKFNYVVAVQDRDKKFATTVKGGQVSTETAYECMMRELAEETTIQPHEVTSIEQIDVVNYNRPYLGEKNPGQCHRYLIHVKLPSERIQQVNTFKSDEIRKVHLIKIQRFLSSAPIPCIKWCAFDFKFVKSVLLDRQIPFVPIDIPTHH